jgi:hypothetical protein
MVAHGHAAAPIPTYLVQIKRQCSGATCCNPEHLFPAAPGGQRLSNEQVKAIVETGDLPTNLAMPAETSGPVIMTEDLDAAKAQCEVDSSGCWSSLTTSWVCRANGAPIEVQSLPRMAPHRWTWMVANGYASKPLPGNRFHVQRRCGNTKCCNPQHLGLTTPDGHELSVRDAETWLLSGHARWQDALEPERSKIGQATVFTEDLDAMRALCEVTSEGCWLAASPGPVACRARDDTRADRELPKMAAHRWTWMIANGRASKPFTGNKIQVRRRCLQKSCCNPDHLYLTAPDGCELTAEEAEIWTTSRHTRWQDALNSNRKSNPTEDRSTSSITVLESTIETMSVPAGKHETGPEGGLSHMTDGLSVLDSRPYTWLDAFPWLKGAAEVGSTPWWDGEIESAHSASKRQHLATISELAMAKLAHWTIGEIFPGLSPGIELRRLGLPTRASNTLIREYCLLAGDLAPMRLDEIMDWRQVGVGVVDAILQGLADASTSLATPPVTIESQPYIAGRSQAAGDVHHDGWVRPAIEDVTEVANWYATIGRPKQNLLTAALPQGTPKTVVDAHRRLVSLSVEDVLGTDKAEHTVAKSFDLALRKLDARAVHVLRHRLFADELLTLDEIGREHGVTRERIRQIEGKARGAMLTILSEDGPLAAIAETARSLIGTIRALDDLLEVLPALGDKVEAVDQPAWRVLDRLDDAYEIEDGWCVVPTLTAAQAMTQTQLQEKSDKYGVVRIDNLVLIETNDAAHRSELTKSWLTRCGYTVNGDFVLTRTQSVGDYGAAILSLAGMPLSAQEIVDRFASERTAGSLRNAMATDDRFERVDRQRWALREWGMEAYTGLRTLIREHLAQKGGRVDLQELIEHITGHYSVSASSVVAYASAPPFEQRDGVVTIAGTDRQVRKTPERTRRLFRCPDGWAYRIRITKDHLRGSGSVAPMAVASILGLQYGESRHLESSLGPQTIAWTGTQPSFGTIRRFLMDGDVSADSEAFLVIKDDGTFAFELVAPSIGRPLLDALALIRARPNADIETAREQLTTAIGLNGTTPISSIIGGYRERGDGDIADLLTQAREYLESGNTPARAEHETDVDDILDLL